MKTIYVIYFVAVIFLLNACASKIPQNIRTPPPDNPQFAEVHQDVLRFKQAKVRWGGTIARVENKASETWIEVVARDLEKSGRPIDNDFSPGRFIAVISGFLDPVVYKNGRDLTVAGHVEKQIQRKIDEYDYLFPLVRVNSHVLWQEIVLLPYDYYPYGFYDPWYPYYYPYYNRRWRKH